MGRSPHAPADSIKTRLAPALPRAEDRRDLHRAFLLDTIARARALPTELRVVLSDGDGGEAAALGLDAEMLRPQRGDGLGEREAAVFADLFAEGFDRVVLVGADIPTLPAARLLDAFEALERSPDAVVLGPSFDGGYYLIGLCRRSRGVPVELFTGIRWSSPFTLSDTLAAAERAGLPVVQLPAAGDMDEAADLDRLRLELAEPAIAATAPATVAALKRLFPPAAAEQVTSLPPPPPSSRP